MTPSKLGDMKDQLRIYIGVLSILFGKQSLLPRGVTRFHIALIDYTSELKYKLDRDKFLAAKMLLAMDQDIQRWLKECKRFKEREEVSDRILGDLPDIIRDVCRGRFFFDLPPVFNGNSMPEDEPQGPPYKKRKIENNIPKDNSRKKVVQNPTPNEE